jgi:hypothetical protein
MLRKMLQLCAGAMAAMCCMAMLVSPALASPVPRAIAHLVNPVIGSANVAMTGPFRWSTAPAAVEYYLAVGTSPGNADVLGLFLPPSQSSLAVPPSLPVGPTLWAAIWTETAGQGAGWFHAEDVSFAVARQAVAHFINPVIGSANVAMSGPFRWSTAPAAVSYYLGVGTSAGNADVFHTFLPPSQTSLDLPPALPVGPTLWAAIWTRTADQGWFHAEDVSFTVAAGQRGVLLASGRRAPMLWQGRLLTVISS